MSSATGTQKFLAHGALEFARTRPIVANALLALNDDNAERLADEERHKIRRSRRLHAAKLVKTHNPTVDRNLAYELVLERYEPGTPRAADTFLTWYLPWNPGGGQVTMHIPAGEVLDHTGADVNPPVFFTAELTGCSVFIRGDRRRPEVFHSGAHAASWQGSAGTHWRALFAKSRPRTFARESYVEVNKHHYMGGDLLGQPYVPLLVKEYIQKVADEEARAGRVFNLVDCTGFGCVFGLRDEAGLWSFYLQENVRVFYRRGPGGPLFQCANRTLRVSRVYPDRAVLSRNEEPKPLP
ncbi:hypothetical protein [Polyangium sp. y55x31]|uniref:hypothetical protein n=1 Tax=Polyangium sp. y55x31 TaxID=3042688 RepID=UPI002482A7A8|nr:hypothetical protein [Polyangium sp. y55x31]MDI1484033.1 hypothetical protein [Polyangium sp. y55x31]